MKRIALALLASGAALAATSARADTRFSVGVHVGAPVYSAPPVVSYVPAPVVHAPPVVAYTPARGYWKEVVVKTWIPERWVMSRDRWGRPVRVCEPGHFAYRTDRVWVDHRHDRHDNRSYGYGYSHNHGWRR